MVGSIEEMKKQDFLKIIKCQINLILNLLSEKMIFSTSAMSHFTFHEGQMTI